MPELGQRSAKERRQAVWQVGLKPFRHWQVWTGLLVTSLAMLWALEMLAGTLLLNPDASPSDSRFVLLAAGTGGIVYLAQLVYTHSYLKAMRRYLRHVTFERGGSAWSAWAKSTVVGLVPAVLLLAGVVGLDWAINSFDESPAPRIAALQHWPQPIAANSNGFVAAQGLQAPEGTLPFNAGQMWIAATNEAALRRATEYPKAPAGLKYAAYVTKPKAGVHEVKASTGANAVFCTPGGESCWNVLREQRSAVQTWLAANQELLVRYQSLQQYPQWQYAMNAGDGWTPFPAYTGLLRAQSLLHATALLAIEKKQTERALSLIAADMRFARKMLAAQDILAGKMVAATMLGRDLALLAETVEQRPADLKSRWAEIGMMLEPLTPAELSLKHALRLEQRSMVAIAGQSNFGVSFGASVPALGAAWAEHHYKRYASANRMLEYYDGLVEQLEARGADYSPVTPAQAAAFAPKMAGWTRFMHNQEGNLILRVGIPDYREYLNRLFDLNALNALARLKLALAQQGVTATDVPAFLAGSDKSLWNPETGKPFEWDAERKQVYFTPASDTYRSRFSLGCGVPGRTGLAVR